MINLWDHVKRKVETVEVIRYIKREKRVDKV